MAKTPAVKDRSASDFEAALKELESIVERMEQGDLGLEESLRCFERGVALTRTCQEALKAAEQRVQILTQEDGDADVQPFGSDDEAG